MNSTITNMLLDIERLWLVVFIIIFVQFRRRLINLSRSLFPVNWIGLFIVLLWLIFFFIIPLIITLTLWRRWLMLYFFFAAVLFYLLLLFIITLLILIAINRTTTFFTFFSRFIFLRLRVIVLIYVLNNLIDSFVYTICWYKSWHISPIFWRWRGLLSILIWPI